MNLKAINEPKAESAKSVKLETITCNQQYGVIVKTLEILKEAKTPFFCSIILDFKMLFLTEKTSLQNLF